MILPNEKIIADYYKTKSARKTAKNFGINHTTVDDILNLNGIKRFSFRESAGKEVIISKGDFKKHFDSIVDCAEWFIKEGIPRTSNLESVRSGLKQARRKNKSYYGYEIKDFKE